MISLLDMPGYREAVDSERLARDASFVDAPECVAGFPLCPLTLRRYLALKAMRHPFIFGSKVTAWDLVSFLWLNHPDFTPKGRMPREFSRKAMHLLPCRVKGKGFWAKVQARKDARRSHEAGLVIQAVTEWLDRMFMDVGPAQESKGFEKQYWSPGCGLVISMARETGWSESDILDLPLPRLFQYQKILSKIWKPDMPSFNPSDRKLSEWLKLQNREN